MIEPVPENRQFFASHRLNSIAKLAKLSRDYSFVILTSISWLLPVNAAYIDRYCKKTTMPIIIGLHLKLELGLSDGLNRLMNFEGVPLVRDANRKRSKP